MRSINHGDAAGWAERTHGWTHLCLSTRYLDVFKYEGATTTTMMVVVFIIIRMTMVIVFIVIRMMTKDGGYCGSDEDEVSDWAANR